MILLRGYWSSLSPARIQSQQIQRFLQRVGINCYAESAVQAMVSKSVRLSVRVSGVCLSVCPLHAGTVSKRERGRRMREG